MDKNDSKDDVRQQPDDLRQDSAEEDNDNTNNDDNERIKTDALQRPEPDDDGTSASPVKRPPLQENDAMNDVTIDSVHDQPESDCENGSATDRDDHTIDVETGGDRNEGEEALASDSEYDSDANNPFAAITADVVIQDVSETTALNESFPSITDEHTVKLVQAVQVDRTDTARVQHAAAVSDIRLRRQCALFSLVVTAVVVTALAVTLSGGNANDDIDIDDPPPPLPNNATGAPTLAPTASPFNGVEFRSNLPNYTSIALLDPASAQSQALNWLESDAYSLNEATDVSRIRRFALATFFYSTGGEIAPATGSWILNNNWLSARPECEWNLASSLACPDGGPFARIFKGGNGLAGTLPNEVVLLQRLDTLQVHDNLELTGTIPTVYGDLTELKFLYLSGSDFTGTLPTELGRCEQIESFRVSNNSFRGILPDQLVWKTAKIYKVANNLLNGTIPEQFSTMTLLNTLDVSGNAFESTIPSSLGLLTALGEMFLDNNAFTGPVPSNLGSLVALRELTLHGNTLTGSVPVEVCDLILLGGLNVTVDCSALGCDCGCQCF